MVLYDDKKWMCRLIRTAFTLEDDSGICENVLKQRPYLGDNVGADSDSFSSDDSLDIREGADAGHRSRSNTAIRLERLEKQRKAHTETVHVRVNPSDVGKNELIFAREDGYAEKKKQKQRAFSIRKLLESGPHPSSMPFATYARYEASCQPTAASKRIAIFLPFLPPKHRSYPVRIVIVASAKISDLIGLTLWVTSQNHPEIELFPPHYYNLLIADEDGEWDTDFPPLDSEELVGKFSFSHLALLRSERAHPDQPQKPKVGLSFLLPNGTTFQIIVDDQELTVGQLISLVLNDSGWASSSISSKSVSVAYHLEKLGDPNTTFTDMNLPLNQCKCKEFCLVRDGAKSVQNVVRSDPFGGRKMPSTSAESPSRSDLYPVMVSTGRFNKLKNALCVIWGGDRMDLEMQHKTKSYPLSSITGVKLDAAKMRVVVSVSQISAASVGSHILPNTSHLTFTTSELSIATELYHHLNSILTTKTK
jgi:hypothetical protein